MIAYFDCFSGMSGDMTLGALVDAGVPLSKISEELALLSLGGYELTAKKVKRGGLRATKVDVLVQKARGEGQGARRWKDVENIIKDSSLSKPIQRKGLAIFKRLFEAEAMVHGGKYTTVHLHELGAVDCVVDIMGSLIGLDILGVDTVYASPLNLGSGFIHTAHGKLPVPAPAAVQLLKGIPVYSSDISFELTTPTGAVLVSSLAAEFGPMPNMIISKIGMGAGNKNFREQPNVLRMFVGQAGEAVKKGNDDREEVIIMETNIDDMNPQVYEYAMDQLFKAGALDVFLTQGIMKKGRPGIKLTVLCKEDKKDDLIHIVLRETTSIGLRFYKAERKILDRQIRVKNTKYGKVKFKETRMGRKIEKASPEYEDCKKIAKKFNIPLLEVIKAVSN